MLLPTKTSVLFNKFFITLKKKEKKKYLNSVHCTLSIKITATKKGSHVKEAEEKWQKIYKVEFVTTLLMSFSIV